MFRLPCSISTRSRDFLSTALSDAAFMIVGQMKIVFTTDVKTSLTVYVKKKKTRQNVCSLLLYLYDIILHRLTYYNKLFRCMSCIYVCILPLLNM